MTYKLEFLNQKVKKAFDKLDNTARSQFKKKLKERLENPRIEADALKNIKNGYKIKLKTLGNLYQFMNGVFVEENHAWRAFLKTK